MSWHLLSPDLVAKVLGHMWLPQLRLLKAVSRSMATACRAVLRGNQSCDGPRWFHLTSELKTQQLSSYKLPLTVSIFDGDFDDDKKCIATVHRLKLMRINDDGDILNARDVHEWKDDRMRDDTIETVVSEMCIEIHGQGICGSEYTLRKLLQQVLRERGRNERARGQTADQVNAYIEEVDPKDGWCSLGKKRGAKQMSLDTLLGQICPATELAKNRWEVHEAPFSLHEDHDYIPLSVIYMCELGLDLFV